MKVPISEEEIYPVYYEEDGMPQRTVPKQLWERYVAARDEMYRLGRELADFWEAME